MVTARHEEGSGWHDAVAEPFGNLSLSPAAKVLHYGLEVFDGHKAFAWGDGTVAFFRPVCHAERLNRSATQLEMPTIPVELQMAAVECLTDLVRAWVPQRDGCSLYLRPMLIATEPALGVVPARSHMYVLFASPAGPYFPSGFEAISVLVEGQRPRAVPGGLGSAKTGGNYAAGMAAKRLAADRGFDEVMFLDGAEHRFVEELSGMNVFVVEEESRLVTPPAKGTILDGVTRRSLLELAAWLGLEAEERSLDIDQVGDAIRGGSVTEVLAVGTAAAVTSVGRISRGAEEYEVGDGRPGPVAKKVRDALMGIQRGLIDDMWGWMHPVPRTSE